LESQIIIKSWEARIQKDYSIAIFITEVMIYNGKIAHS